MSLSRGRGRAPTLYLHLAKILPLLVLPPGLVLLLGALGLAVLLRGRQRAGASLLGGALLLLWVASLPVTAGALYRHLESPYPPLALAAVPAARCAVVLGGAVGAAAPPREDVELQEAADRVHAAARLYRAGRAARILVAAGNQPWAVPGPAEAELIASLLVQWGVPADAIRLERASRNTRENVLNLLPLLADERCGQPLLITSAAHMPRAVAAFATAGVTVIPFSTDVRVAAAARLTLPDFLPDARALVMTSDALREWLGRRVYEWRDWN